MNIEHGIGSPLEYRDFGIYSMKKTGVGTASAALLLAADQH
jgi:hypothetical protein